MLPTLDNLSIISLNKFGQFHYFTKLIANAMVLQEYLLLMAKLYFHNVQNKIRQFLHAVNGLTNFSINQTTIYLTGILKDLDLSHSTLQHGYLVTTLVLVLS